MPPPIARSVTTPLAAIGPLTGKPSQTQRIMVLESDSKECIPKTKPPKPRPANKLEPAGLPMVSSPPLFSVVCLVERKIAISARNSPVLFQPPFWACIMGQIGLLVREANFVRLEASKPILQANTCASRRTAWDLSTHHVADQARQAIETPKPTANRRSSGAFTR